jgi:serine/threonine protein kinase
VSGPSSCLSRMQSKTVQIVSLEFIHDRGFIHGDVTPGNVGFSTHTRKICIFDFGLATPFTTRHGKHIQGGRARRFFGTPLFASVNTQCGLGTTAQSIQLQSWLTSHSPVQA